MGVSRRRGGVATINPNLACPVLSTTNLALSSLMASHLPCPVVSPAPSPLLPSCPRTAQRRPALAPVAFFLHATHTCHVALPLAAAAFHLRARPDSRLCANANRRPL